MSTATAPKPWQSEILQSFSKAWIPPDNRSIYLWAADNVVLSDEHSLSGKFSVDRSRYMIAPFDALAHPDIRQVNVMASPRSGKSTIGEIFLLHRMVTNSGKFLWTQASDAEMKKFYEERLLPLLDGCKAASDLLDKSDNYAVTKNRIRFSTGTVILSGLKKTAVQMLGYKTIVIDEAWLAKKGLIGQAKSRTRDWQSRSKLYMLSTGGIEGDDWTKEFERGVIYNWGWLCPNCNQEQTLHWNKKRDDGTWSGIYWPTNEITKPDGVWNIAECAKVAVLQCHHCRHNLTDTPANRRYLNDTGRYICTKTDKSDLKVASYRWNDLANIEVTFATLVTEFLQAKVLFKATGIDTDWQEFKQKRLAESHLVGLPDEAREIILAEYNPSEAWGDYTFMTLDCQKDFAELYYVIRRWKKTGESRLVKYGKVGSPSEARQVQIENGIKDQCVFIDQGYQANLVYSMCCDYSHIGTVNGKKRWLSWTALRGDQKYTYRHPDKSNRYYNVQRRGPSGKDKSVKDKPLSCPCYDFSSDKCTGILLFLRDGKGVSWVANEVCDEYQRQLNSHYPASVLSKSGKPMLTYAQKVGVPDHYLDCEKQQIVAALLTNCLGDMTKQSPAPLDRPLDSEGE